MKQKLDEQDNSTEAVDSRPNLQEWIKSAYDSELESVKPSTFPNLREAGLLIDDREHISESAEDEAEDEAEEFNEWQQVIDAYFNNLVTNSETLNQMREEMPEFLSKEVLSSSSDGEDNTHLPSKNLDDIENARLLLNLSMSDPMSPANRANIKRKEPPTDANNRAKFFATTTSVSSYVREKPPLTQLEQLEEVFILADGPIFVL